MRKKHNYIPSWKSEISKRNFFGDKSIGSKGSKKEKKL